MEINTYQEDFNSVINYLKTELLGIRSGRANAAMLEGITVDAYGAKTPLKGVASISVPDAHSMVVDPWDKSLVKAVEDAIRNSGKGFNPVNEGQYLRVVIPALTEDSRKALVKLIGEKAEETRIKIRQLRDRIKDDILRAEESNEIAEDQRFKMQDNLDKKVKDINENIKKIVEEKEKEIMTV